MPDKNYNLVDLVKVTYKWRKPILIITFLAIVVSVVVSLLLPNYYESMVVFFPSNPALTDRQNLFRTNAGDLPVGYFGKEKDADRLLQIGKSSQLAAYIIEEFDLMKHYDIDPENTRYPQYTVNKEFEDNYQIFKNEYGAIEIHVIDQDKNLAAEMANTIVDHIDQINNAMVRGNKSDILAIFKNKLSEKKAVLDSVNTALMASRKNYNIYEVDPTYDRINKNHANADFNLEGIDKIKSLEAAKISAMEAYETTSMLYDQYQTSEGKDFSSTYILERAYPAEKKVKPIRWLIVVTTTLLTLFICILTAALYEQAKLINFKEDY